MSVSMLLAMLGLAAAPAAAQPAIYPYEVVTVTLPAGNADAGRQAFEDLKCHVCHRVSGERRFAPPVAELRGPALNALLPRQQTSDIAAAIIAPSHSMSIRTSEAVKAQISRLGASPMGDFSRVMTVRQLADLLAYLRSVR